MGTFASPSSTWPSFHMAIWTNSQEYRTIFNFNTTGAFGDCSSPCGGGFRIRRRKCDNPTPQNGGMDCPGCSIDYEICNSQPCAEVKRLSSWTPWLMELNGTTGDGGHTERRFRYLCKASVADSSTLRIALAKEETRICQPDGTCQR